MKKPFIRLWKSGKTSLAGQIDPVLKRSCAGRIISTLRFIVFIICLGLWIAAFVLFQDRLSAQTVSGNILTNLKCLTFFGGLVIAIFIGALVGNLLQRAFWKWLTGRSNRKR